MSAKSLHSEFSSATTLFEFIQNESNNNEKQIKRYIRKANNVVIDFGYSCKITIEKISSSTLKLREVYGPLMFTNYVEVSKLKDYIDYKSTTIKQISDDDNIETIGLSEKRLELIDTKLDIEETIESSIGSEQYKKLRIVYSENQIELYRNSDDAKMFTIEINEFGRGLVKHHVLGLMKTNNLDFFNADLLILYAKIVECMIAFNFNDFTNFSKAVKYLQHQTKLSIPDLENEEEIRQFLHSVDDIIIENGLIRTTITKKTRIKIDITSIRITDDLIVYNRSFKAKDIDAESLYDLVKHVVYFV